MNMIYDLEKNQILGDNKINIFKRYGAKAKNTDFAILLGGLSENYSNYGYWAYYDSFDTCISTIETEIRGLLKDIHIGIRPTFQSQALNGKGKIIEANLDGTKVIEYGVYPQTVADYDTSLRLESMYKKNLLRGNLTRKKYSIPSKRNDSLVRKPELLVEYFDKNEKYIRIVANKNAIGRTLSTNDQIKKRQAYWVKVEPIRWLIDENENVAITENILFAGLREYTLNKYIFDMFLNDSEIDLNEIKNETIKEPEIVSKRIEKTDVISSKKNPYKFDFDEISEEDIIKGAIESNVAVFLHGKSSDGKSARVKQIDPNCQIIYLRNATPDSLNGKSVYNAEKGEMIDIPPSWYKKIKARCEAEPDKLHILFFDEITNALPSIQGMAFNIILDKEVNGIWKLPSNCRIIAAGNHLDDSLAANQMAEPLFNRFAHIYINTTVESWLEWAIKPENHIHPSIYAYMVYNSSRKANVLRTPYNGEKPNADPRKWEMASKVLYATNNPEMLRALIGEELTKDFIAFCKNETITLEDVLKENYSENDFKINLSAKYATVVGLLNVEEKDIEVVRKFISRLGTEFLATFDLLWCKGDENRLEKIASLKIEEQAFRRI